MVLRRVHRVRQVRGETAAAAQGVGPNWRPCAQMRRHIRAGKDGEGGQIVRREQRSAVGVVKQQLDRVARQ